MSIFSRLRTLDLRTDILPFVVATAGEFTALFFWLHYLDQGRFWLANGILWAGFLVERLSVIIWIRYVYRGRAGAQGAQAAQAAQPKMVQPLLITAVGLLAITLTEILIWIFWVALADGQIAWLAFDPTTNFALAAAVLMVLMLAQHSVEMAALKEKRPWAYLANANTIFFTFMEVAGAVAWLYFVRNDQPVLGGICLLIGLSIEHVFQGSDLRPEEAAAPAGPGVAVAR